MATDARWLVARVLMGSAVLAAFPSSAATEDLLREAEISGRFGGILSTAKRTEPRTFNPIAANDSISRDLIARMHADLIHINRRTLKTESALARAWSVSKDGRVYTLQLRRGIRFSDGTPMDADDVVFTFSVYLDKSVNAPQRDLLVVEGKPISVRKVDAFTVRFELAAPYAAAERLFDGIPILPRRRLSKAYEEGTIARAWGTDTAPDQIAGLGPFRLRAYVPGERVVLEKNPYYWKTDRDGRRLPYLDGLAFEILPNEGAQTIRFASGGLDVISPLSGDNFLELKKREQRDGFRVYDAGPGLEYNVLVFNMNDPGPQASAAVRGKRSCFHQAAFRRAVSRAIDRPAIARLAYRGLAEPLWGHVTGGNNLWLHPALPRPGRSISEAREILKDAAFTWKDGALMGPDGTAVTFSILVSASNTQRARIASLIQEDLRELGIKVSVVTLEFRTMLDRVFNRFEYDAAVMAIASGDADPNAEMNVWLSGGSMHVWNLAGRPQTPWEEEIDRLMRLQMTTLDLTARQTLYRRVQELVAEHVPVIPLASPAVLVGASKRVGNFAPSILRSHALWNVESLYLRAEQ